MPEEQEVQQVEEQEPVAAEVDATNAPEATAEDSSEPESKPKGGFQRKIDKLTREKADAAREAEYWRTQALRTPPVEAEKPKAEPSENDFQTHAEYVKALTKWTATQAVEEFKASQRTESVKTQQQTAQQQFKARQDAFRAATPDFDEVLADADTQVSNAVIAEIVESDHGPQLQYYLAQNPDEAVRLSGLAPLALAREVGKIESRFTSSPSKAATVTRAPAPISPVGKATSTSKSSFDATTYAEFEARRNAELAARQR